MSNKSKLHSTKRSTFLSSVTFLATVSGLSFAAPGIAQAQELNIQSARANVTKSGFPASNAIDGDRSFASRWNGKGDPERLTLDLGSNQTIDDVQIAWARGNRTVFPFRIDARTGTRGRWTVVFRGNSSGRTNDFENYNVTDMRARQVRIVGTGSGSSSITEVKIIGTGGSSPTPAAPPPAAPPPTAQPPATSTGGFGLNPNDDPWENFDLREWKIDTPGGDNSSSDCDAQDTEPQEWTRFNQDKGRSQPYFFTHTDGGMRFISEFGRATTGGDCGDKSRSELREMLRGSNTSIDTTGRNGDFRNNWALGSSSGEYQPRNHNGNSGESWGAREGRMRATLIVNDVTESGGNSASDRDQGNVVIGQIHASSDEPLRLHYRHRPGRANGCIYAASEIRDGDDVNFNIIGDVNCTTSPSNGIALGEMFSYEIVNDGGRIIVRIFEGDFGRLIEDQIIDLDRMNSGYDRSDEWNYFKAGAYSQNDDGTRGDRDIVTFYRLDVDH